MAIVQGWKDEICVAYPRVTDPELWTWSQNNGGDCSHTYNWILQPTATDWLPLNQNTCLASKCIGCSLFDDGSCGGTSISNLIA